jgi:ATP-binding cassette subfamily B protein
MDCGPASLKCVLDGHGIAVSYSRLRDVCQTDVDGTSIDTIETVANQLGLTAEQIVIPADHLLLPEAAALPAVVVVWLSERLTHFVVLWRRVGNRVQVMDPAGGRRWMRTGQLMRELYQHRMTVPAVDWRAWAGTDECTGALRARLVALGVDRATADRLVTTAIADPSWRGVATLDATTRMAAALVDSGGLGRGAEAKRVIVRLVSEIQEVPDQSRLLPERFWSVLPLDGDVDSLTMTGAVLVRFPGDRRTQAMEEGRGVLGREAVASLHEEPVRPVRRILSLLRADRSFSIPLVIAATMVAAVAVAAEAILFRSLLDLGHDLGIREQRLIAVAAVLLFILLLTAIDLPLSSWLLAAGRRLEASLRLRFFAQVPRLGDRYFHSRLTSDIAERVHSLHVIRQVPTLAGRFVRLVCEVLATTAGIIWIDPASAVPAVLLAVGVIGIPLLSHPVLTELELRMRTHAGALSRYYLDALIGLVPLRAHGAERPLRGEHRRVLNEWTRSGRQLLSAAVGVETVQTAFGFGVAAWLLWSHLARGGEASSLLLLYWALRVPILGDELALVVRQYPPTRNVMLRLLEPLLAPASPAPDTTDTTPAISTPGGVSIVMKGVEVEAAGRTLLRGVHLAFKSGEHVAIVGVSGAGKSTLAGLLLGWHVPAAGALLIDGQPLDAAGLEALRRVTVWVDPAVHLWNRSLLENLQYGNPSDAGAALGFAVTAADLQGLVEKLPHGLQTALGEGGALVSGGEGQRVRLGRALLRQNVRLVVLDEPFRGLDRDARRRLTSLVREHWRHATLVCISHDVSDTQSFERVLVVDNGAIVEDGHPAMLLRTSSRYRDLVTTERVVHDRLWSSPVWRRVRIDGGRIEAEERVVV